MQKLLAFAAVAALVLGTASAYAAEETPDVLKFKMKSLAGKEINLADYQGKVVLIVNVASECGYTPQYEGLQGLHEKYGKEGLVVLGVPCNQFGAQEPGSDAKIADFCKTEYGVTFPMLSKVDVNDANACGLYKHLTSKETDPKFAGPITWNFEKFLIARDGSVAGRFKPAVEPDAPELTKAIEAELKKKQ